MKKPASSPGLLQWAVCARVTNINILTVTNAGCRMRLHFKGSASLVLRHITATSICPINELFK